MESGDPTFLSLLLSIGRDLTDEDFENLKFLCQGTIPASHLENLTRPRELFLELIRCCDLSEQNKDPLSTLLFHINRHDLNNRLLGVEGTFLSFDFSLGDRKRLTSQKTKEVLAYFDLKYKKKINGWGNQHFIILASFISFTSEYEMYCTQSFYRPCKLNCNELRSVYIALLNHHLNVVLLKTF